MLNKKYKGQGRFSIFRRLVKEILKNPDAIELLSHPAYSQEFASSDYYFFAPWLISFADAFLTISARSKKSVVSFLFQKTKPREKYSRGTDQFANNWVQTIDSNGLYFETKSLFIVVSIMLKVAKFGQTKLVKLIDEKLMLRWRGHIKKVCYV